MGITTDIITELYRRLPVPAALSGGSYCIYNTPYSRDTLNYSPFKIRDNHGSNQNILSSAPDDAGSMAKQEQQQQA